MSTATEKQILLRHRQPNEKHGSTQAHRTLKMHYGKSLQAWNSSPATAKIMVCKLLMSMVTAVSILSEATQPSTKPGSTMGKDGKYHNIIRLRLHSLSMASHKAH